MKTIGKIFLGFLGFLFLFALSIQFGYNTTFNPPYPEVKVTTDSATLAHGEYLIFGPAHCVGCHSSLANKEAVEAGEKVPLSGGNTFTFSLGSITPKNLTPDAETGIGRRTDGELARTLRYAVDHKGHTILPFMPFTYMSEGDMSAIISYLRAQEPVRNEIPDSKYTFMGKLMKWYFIRPTQPTREVEKDIQPDSTAEYGRYLAYSVANCMGCHTTFNMQKMEFDDAHFAGGSVMEEKTHRFTSPNLTPCPQTGHIVQWSEAQFVQRFKAGKVFEDSPMPWDSFSRMKERDLKALYRFLQSLEPIENEIEAVVQLR